MIEKSEEQNNEEIQDDEFPIKNYEDYASLKLEEIQQMHYVFNIDELDRDGYWLIMVFNFTLLHYIRIDSPIISYKGRIFDTLDTPPWDEARIEKIRSEINIINKDGTPLCVCIWVRALT